MADCTIGELNEAEAIFSDDLLLIEHAGEAMSLKGQKLTEFIDRNVVAINVNIVPATEAGGGTYNNGVLTLDVPRGYGISGIILKSSANLTDTYEVSFEDGAKFDFDVKNGTSIQSVSKNESLSSGIENHYDITLTDGTVITDAFTVRDGTGQVSSVNGVQPASAEDGSVVIYASNIKMSSASSSNTVDAEIANLNTSVHNLQSIVKEDASPDQWQDNSSPYSDFPVRGRISIDRVTANHYAEVIFSPEDALSGDYAPVCTTATNCVYIYATAIPSTTLTIPTIICRR